MRGVAIFLDWRLSGYDLDELEDAILDSMEDKWESCEDYTVSVGEIASVFGRDPHNIRPSNVWRSKA